MKLLSKLLSENDENKSNPEQSESGEPETEEVFHIETEVEDERTKKTAKIRFTSGREEKITYHDFEQNGERRKYMRVTDYKPHLKYTWREYRVKIAYSMEQVAEVSMRNIEKVKIIEEETEMFDGRIDREYGEDDLTDARRKFLKNHEDAKHYEKEVDDGASE